jgi:aspartate-semialdehyde dehydrogenase
VSVKLARSATAEEIIEAWQGFTAEPQWLELPTAPANPILYDSNEASPQPRLHRNAGGGMAVTVGRLRPCPVLDFKFVVLSHNTIRGAAGGSLLTAELVVAKRVVPSLEPPRAAGD